MRSTQRWLWAGTGLIVLLASGTFVYRQAWQHETADRTATVAKAPLPADVPVFRITEGQPGSPYPYSPSTLHIPAGRVVAVELTDNLGGCGLVTVFPGLAVNGGDARARVPVGTTQRIYLKAPRPGRYRFHCSENMYFGTIIAE